MVRIHVQTSPSVDDRTARLITAIIENRWIALIALTRLDVAERCIAALAAEQSHQPPPFDIGHGDIDATVLEELREFAKAAFSDVQITIDPGEGDDPAP